MKARAILLIALAYSQAQAAGIYDGEIAAMRKHFGAYIAQSEKNIAALSRLAAAYDRMNEATANVIAAKKTFVGRCPSDTKEKMLACLSRQFSSITMLDLYVRRGNEIIPEAIADVRDAGRILSQDVSAHLMKFERASKALKTWRDETIPAMRKILAEGREALKQKYAVSFVDDYRLARSGAAAAREPELLATELTEAGQRLFNRGHAFIAKHRLGHAKVTAAAIQWLSAQVPIMWRALDQDLLKEERVAKLKTQVEATLAAQHEQLKTAISSKDPATERSAALRGLKLRAQAHNFGEGDREAFAKLIASIDELAKKQGTDAHQDSLIERGYAWLEASSQ